MTEHDHAEHVDGCYRCDLSQDEAEEHTGTVDCDFDCGALEDPETEDELRAAYEHWRWHPYSSGCSHGA